MGGGGVKTRLVVLTLYKELFQLEQHNYELEIKNEVLTGRRGWGGGGGG